MLNASPTQALPTSLRYAVEDATPVDWSEEDVVFLHWKLLEQLVDLSEPATPLYEKLDILRWVFTDPELVDKPFSFASCVKVVSSSPLSPTPYFGAIDVEEIRDWIRHNTRGWLRGTIARYPAWVQELIRKKPQWVEARLAKNPQWLNEQVKQNTVNGDLFA